MRFGRSEDRQPAIDFSEFVDGLYSYALMLSRNSAEAEDLVQETCLRAIRAMDKLRPDSNVKSWLFTILRNIWFNEVRRRRGAPTALDIDLDEISIDSAVAPPPKDPHAVYVSKIERDQVRAAIQQLSVEFREIVILREYEELSYQEIAAVLECPVGTVMSRLARARAQLREMLPAAGSMVPASVKPSVKREGDRGDTKIGCTPAKPVEYFLAGRVMQGVRDTAEAGGLTLLGSCEKKGTGG